MPSYTPLQYIRMDAHRYASEAVNRENEMVSLFRYICRLTCLDKLEDSENALGRGCQGKAKHIAARCLLVAEFTLEWS